MSGEDTRVWTLYAHGQTGDLEAEGPLIPRGMKILVVPQARLREVEVERDKCRARLVTMDLFPDHTQEVERRCKELKSRLRQCEEALEAAQDFLETVLQWQGSDPDELDEVCRIVAAALPGAEEERDA